jgi:hypothetical protein
MASVLVSSTCLMEAITSEFFLAAGSMQSGTNMSGNTIHNGADGLAATDQESHFTSKFT